MELIRSDLLFKYKAIIFDLDNTLYQETEFLFSAYKAIGKFIAKTSGKDHKIYEAFLRNRFNNSGRKYLFDALLEKFNLQNMVLIEEMLEILHNHIVPLTLKKEPVEIINMLIKKNKLIFILTNGNKQQQQNKINGLKIPILFPQINIIYANDYEPKPSPFCINYIRKQYRLEPSEIILIGDSETDKLTADNSNIDFKNISDYEN